MRNLSIQLLLLELATACLGAEPATGKIITFAGVPWGVIPPQVIQQDFAAFDALPFDGLVYAVDTTGQLHAHGLNTTIPWPTNAIAQGVAIMRSLPFKQLTHNYAALYTTEIQNDWFDDPGWAEVVRRCGLFAEAARASGAAGIMLDTEAYNKKKRLYCYPHQARREEKSFAEYSAKARQRGAEVMRAIRRGFPGVHLYLTYATSLEMRSAEPSSAAYGLLPGFVDGLLAESKGCVITDGFEQAYKYQTDDEFAQGAKLIRDEAARLSTNPRLYRQRLKVGFGIWPAGTEKGLNTTNFTVNNHTPLALECALRSALRHSDGIVWVYGGGVVWTNAPPAYLEAIANARVPTLGERAAKPAGATIIAFAGMEWGTPPPYVIRQNLKAWDALPFDGFVFDISQNGRLHHTCLLPEETINLDDLRAGVATMQALPARKLLQNYARLNTTSIQNDWFDDPGWAEIVRRCGVFAKAAHDGGAVGIMLDTEQYDAAHQQFQYSKQAHTNQHSFAAYSAKARQRGAEMMAAFRQNFPGVKLCLTFGPSMVREEGRTSDITRTGYGLIVGFFDGLLQESEGCQVFDGYEQAYPFRTDDEFARAADTIRNATAKLSAAPRFYRRHAQVSFGLWPVGSEKGWNTNDFTRNPHTPVELEYALGCALRHSDGLVWVYGGGVYWTNSPSAYLDAIAHAKTPRFKSPPGRLGREADQTVFENLHRQCTERLDLGAKWRLRVDPNDVGVTEGWFAPGVSPQAWRPIRIREFWDAQLDQVYTGYAWYRVEFNVKAAWLKEPLLLAFGAVDELAWVYLNGQPVYDHAQGNPAELWNQPFAFDIRTHARPGQNVLAVRVHNSWGPGGIWRGVKLFGPVKR